MEVHSDLLAAYAPLVEWPPRYRYFVYHGGRGGGKTTSMCRAAILRCLARRETILCAREFQNSLADSVYRVLVEQIDALGVRACFDVQRNKIICRTTGSDITFTGLDKNIASVKSRQGITICFVDEASVVAERSWEELIPTVRAPGSQIWVSLNPGLESDATSQRFLEAAPPATLRRRVNWRNNPHFPAALEMERRALQANDYESYLHVYEGQYRTTSDAQVFKGAFRVEEFTARKSWGDPLFGADWGFGSTDPTVLVRCWIHNRRLWIDREVYRYRADIADLPAAFAEIQGSKRFPILADNSQPGTIRYMQGNGFPLLTGAPKGPGSIESGIQHIRGAYESVVIHPRCVGTASDFRLYAHRVDKRTGRVTADLVDKDNHAVDSVRYALADIIRQANGGTESSAPVGLVS